MRAWRSFEFRLAAWYSFLLMVGLASLGAVLWLGVNYSMVAAVDELLEARVQRVVDFVNAEFGEDYLESSSKLQEGEFKGEVERVDVQHGSLFINGTKIRLTAATVFDGGVGSFGPSDLQPGQYVGVEVTNNGSEWVAAEISLETGFREDLQEELSEYVVGVPDGRLMHIRTASGHRLLPVDADSEAQSLIPWQEPGVDGRIFSTLETSDSSFRVLNSEARLVGRSFRIQVASSLAAVTRTRERLLSWLLWAVPAGLLLSFSGGYVISRAALRPVEKVVSVAGEMDVNHLSERLEVPQTGDVVQRLAETFNGMLGRLETSVKRLEEFTADASHELRSPVTVIRTTAELALRQARTEDELRKDMKEIQDEATRLTDLIEDLLTLARADSGADGDPMGEVDLAALAREVSDQYRRVAGRRKLDVEIEATDAVVRGHAASLRRLFVILLDNAVQHTPEDAAIQVSVTEEGDRLALAVTDTGEGIPPDELNRVFDRFYRADPSRNRSQGGFGLGLSIARWIAESHNGSITAKSELGLGSTFSFLLPRRRPS